jgi:molybdopterin-biosynthesis enzyme MoeA-like protein
MESVTIRADLKEGDIGTELGELAREHPAVMIGSYPFFDEKTGPNTNVVLRSRDASALRTASASVEAMIERVKKNLAA